MDDVAHHGPLAGAAKAAHAVLHVGEEALARLLAVVADVDAGLELACHDVACRFLDGGGKGSGINVLAAVLAHEQLEERWAARQAKNFAESDRLRDELQRTGFTMRDRKDGYDLVKLDN